LRSFAAISSLVAAGRAKFHCDLSRQLIFDCDSSDLRSHAAEFRILNKIFAAKERKEHMERYLDCSLFCTAIVQNHAILTRFLPQRNVKNTEIRAYVVFSLRSLRSFVANSLLVAAMPRWALCALLRPIHLWLRLATILCCIPIQPW
jgi:hypothetical protein